MKWLIKSPSNKNGYKICLPDNLTPGEAFTVQVDDKSYIANWDRSSETLFLSPTDNPDAERVYSVRGATTESFPDEPEISIDMEYLSPDAGASAFQGKAEIFIPGVKNRSTGDGTQGAIMRSPMAGKVLSIEVEEGQTISKGDLVCVIEAMKMENQIQASASGKVSNLNIKPGDQLALRDKLLIIKE